MSSGYDPVETLLEGHGSGGGHEDGEGNWLVSYADMMTLLVGFFVILLSFSNVDQEKFELAKKSLTEKFGGNYQKPFDQLSKRIKEALDKAGLGDQFDIKTDDSGVTISFLGTVFFTTGSADFKPQAKVLLNSLIPLIKAETLDLDILIEGHTDDIPLVPGGVFRNNWELSSIRACRVLDYFSQGGFDDEKLKAIGYGDTRPLAPNRDDDDKPLPENQSQNRRVVIKLIPHGQKGM